MASQSIDGFTTTGPVLLSKTAGTATFAGNVNGGGLTINGAGGTLNLGSGLTHTFTGAWTSTDGTLNGGSSLLKIGGNGSVTGGTFTAGSGTVEWYAGGAQTCANVTYNNLTLSGSGAKTVTGVTVNGILSMEGTATAVGTTPTYGAAATLQYKGSAAQTTGIEFPATFNGTGGVIVDNPSGITLSSTSTVAGILTMIQGNITTGINTLRLSNSDASSLIRTSGTIIGRLNRAVSTPVSADYIFPVGTAAFYRPATMNFSSLAAFTEITAEFITTPPESFAAYTDETVYLNNTFTEGYWRFFSSGLPDATYSLILTGNGFSSYSIDGFTRISARDNGNSTWRPSGDHGSQAGNIVSRNDLSNLNTTSFDFALATGCDATMLGYGHERNITIDYTKVAGGSDLYNFPVLIHLSGQKFLETSPTGKIFNPNGFDIIFTDNSYNKLDHQLEYYNGTNGDLIAWVRIPTLLSSSNTILKILYGNPQVTADPSVTSVWDSHYKGVWHLDNNSLNDYTAFNKAGTPYNTPTYPAGWFSNALGLNGTSQYVEVINAPNLNFAGNITVSAWVYMDTGGRDQKIAGNQNNSSGGYKFGIYTNNKVEFEIRNAANTPSLNRDVTGGTVLNTGQWYYLGGMSSDVLDSIGTFVNGIPERPFKKTGILGIASDNLSIGKEPFLSNYYFDGMFDEIRISDRVRSNGWMRTEYNNQSSPLTFYTLDNVGINSDTLPSAGMCTVPISLTFGYPAGGTYSGNSYIAGNVFNPPSAGTYSITYTYNAGCGPVSVTKYIKITAVPPPPVALNKEYCINQITYLEAVSGENIRWYSGGSLVSTANPFSTGQTAAGTYNYAVTQTVNGCESIATPVSLTIYNGITINSQPQPATICAGDNAAFSVSASGLNLSYRWQENGVNLSDGGIYSGSATPTLNLINPGFTKNGKLYRCVVSTACGASPVNTAAAVLGVTSVPVATFSYTGTPYCPNAANPSPTFSGGGSAGTFSSSAGLVFVSTATGQVNLAASIPGSYIVTNTITPSGGCNEVTATSPFTIISDLTWTGTSSTNWNDPGNWPCGIIPSQIYSAVIPDVPNKPVLNSGAMGSVKNLTIEPGSSLTISGNILQISGTISNNGTFITSDGSIIMNGASAQTIGPSAFTGNTIRNLTISNPAGVSLQGPLDVTGSVNITNGNLSSDGNLTLASTAIQTAFISGTGTGTILGNVTIQRYLASGFGYKYFSSPFQASTINEFGDDMDLAASFPAIYRYDEDRTSSGWISYVNPANTLIPLEGYAVNFGSIGAPNTVDVTGIVNNGPLSVTLYNHDHPFTKGFNLVGNPFPSAVDWDASSGWTKTNIDNALYYFKASTTDEYGGTYSTYINGISSDGLASAIIPSMQGFFVHVTDGAFPVAGILGLNNSVRVTDLTPPFFKSGEKGSGTFLRLSASFDDDPSSTDPMVVYFDEKAGTGFDSNHDALKLMNTDYNAPNLYSEGSDGVELSINALPVSTDTICIVPLGLKLNKTGIIIFKITELAGGFSETKISITDIVAGTENNLLSNEEYHLFLESGEYKNRFFLNLVSRDPEEPDPGSGNNLFSVYSSHGLVTGYINPDLASKGTLTISNLIGQIVYVEKIFNPGHFEFNPGFKNGIYIVTFISDNLMDSKKIFIQNR